jgi:inorganic pyrophosphatase/exopolyphosphatase
MDASASGMPAHASSVPMHAANIRRAPIFSDTRSFKLKTTQSLKPMPKSSSLARKQPLAG